jgi:hypothetical protein
VSSDESSEVFEKSDVVWIATGLEGMYQTLIGAMGRGCVPVMYQGEDDGPVPIHHGHNGFLVPRGDAAQFVDCLAFLQREPEHRRELLSAAHRTARRTAYRTEDMVRAYLEVFERVLSDAKSGIYQRPPGELQPPPQQLDGLDIFPVTLTHEEEGVGVFISETEYRDFRTELKPHARFKGRPRRTLVGRR